MQHDLARVVAEVHPVKSDIAQQPGVGDGAVVVRMFPGPDVGALGVLLQCTVGLFPGIDQGDVALIGLGLFIHQVKNPLGAGHGHNDGIGLHADLADRLGGVFVEGKKGDQSAQGQPGVAVQSQHRADDGTQHIADVAQVGVDGHGQVGEGVGLVGTVPQGVVELAELLDAFFLVAEDLDHLLAFHHLLNVGVDGAQVLLLAGKVEGGTPGNAGGDQQHDGDHGQGEQRQGNVQHQHAHKGGDDGHQGVDDLGNALADELAQGVHIVGVDRHDVAVGVGVEVTDGEGFHVLEQLHAEIAHGALADVDHDAVVAVGTQDAHRVEERDPQQGGGQRPVVGIGGTGQGCDVIVNEPLGEQHPLDGSQCRTQNADHHHKKGKLVISEHVTQHPAQGGGKLPDVGGFLWNSHGMGHHCAPSFPLSPGWSKSPPALLCASQISR